MKRVRLSIIVSVLCLTIGLAGAAGAADPIAAAIAKGTSDFMKGVLEKYGTSEKIGAALKAVGVKEEELPLLLMVAKQSKKSPEEIAKQRLAGMSWDQIMKANNVSPEVVYAPPKGPAPSGPPYGNAYGYFRNKPQKDWKNIKLTDDEAVGMANVKYLSERHQVPPDEIIRRKAQGRSFTAVDDDIKKEKIKKGQGATAEPKGQGNSGNPKVKGNSGNAGQGHGNSGNPKAKGNSGQGHGNGGGNGKGPK